MDVSNNLLTNIPTDLSRLKNVIELCIGYNKFTSFPEGLTTLPKVEVLSVECNNLTEIPQSITNLAPSLKKLHLMSNRLVDLPDHFRLLKNLDELDMRGNPLGQLGFGTHYSPRAHFYTTDIPSRSHFPTTLALYRPR